MTNLQTLREQELAENIADILNILAYQAVITSQGTNYTGEKDWALNKILNLIAEQQEKFLRAGQQDMLERVRDVIKRNKEIENWSHSVGSHSDDRGGDSDIECTCREKEVRYKIEALDSLLKALDNLIK